MYKKIMTLICLFCLCFSFRVYAEELFIGDNQTRTDYSAYMNVSIPKNSTGKAMLLFRAKNIELLGYGLSYYEVGFDTGSKIVFRKYYTGYYIAKTVTLDSVNVDNDGSSKNITVEAVGNSFKIYLDGELIIDYTDNGTYDKINAIAVFPFSFGQLLDEQLDEAHLTVKLSPKEHYEPLTEIKIDITDGGQWCVFLQKLL